MKKLFIAVVLVLFSVLPLGSAKVVTDPIDVTIDRDNVWTYRSYESVMQNRKKQLTCLAKNIYFEARNEPFVGQFAVALVTLNRVHDTDFPNTVCEVVYEGIHTASGFPKRDRCQFSWYCDGKHDEPSKGKMWKESKDVATYALTNTKMLDITDGATHYHADYIPEPRWATRRDRTMQIDTHIFYNKHKNYTF